MLSGKFTDIANHLNKLVLVSTSTIEDKNQDAESLGLTGTFSQSQVKFCRYEYLM